MEKVEVAPPLTSKPEYQPVPTAALNANYPTITTSPPQTFGITQDTHYSGPRPNNFLVLTLITLFCCMGWPALFCSVIAVVYSLQVDLAWDVGHHSGARSSSDNAKKWAIAAIVTGVVTVVAIIVFYGVLYGLGVASAYRGQ